MMKVKASKLLEIKEEDLVESYYAGATLILLSRTAQEPEAQELRAAGQTLIDKCREVEIEISMAKRQPYQMHPTVLHSDPYSMDRIRSAG